MKAAESNLVLNIWGLSGCGRVDHRLDLIEIFQGDVTKDPVPLLGGAPWRDLCHTDPAFIGQHLFAPRATGVKAATGGRI